MKVLVGGTAAMVLVVLAGSAVAGGFDVPETEPSVILDGDTDDASGTETNPEDGTAEAVPDGGDPGDTSPDEQPTNTLVGVTSGGIGDETDSNLVTDIGVFLPGDDKDHPVDDLPTAPTEEEDPSVTITITSVPQTEPVMEAGTGASVPIPTTSAAQDMPGTGQEANATEIGSLSTSGDDGTQCYHLPDRRAVRCD